MKTTNNLCPNCPNAAEGACWQECAPAPVWAIFVTVPGNIFVTVPGHSPGGFGDQTFEVAHGWATKEDAEAAMSRLNEIAQSSFWWVNDPLQNQIDLAKAVDGATFDLDELESFIGFPMHVGAFKP